MTMAAAPLAVLLLLLLAGGVLLLLVLLRRRRSRCARHDQTTVTAAAHHPSGFSSTTGALAAVAVFVARLLLARAVHALLAAVRLLVAYATMWLLRCSVTGDAAKQPSAGSDGAATLQTGGCGGLARAQPAPPAKQQQQSATAFGCGSTGISISISSSSALRPRSGCLPAATPTPLSAPPPAARAVGHTGTSPSRLAHCTTPSWSHGLQLGAAAAPAWADATAYVAVADHAAAAASLARRQAADSSSSGNSTGLLSAQLELAAGGGVDASRQSAVAPDVTTQPQSHRSTAAAAVSSRCVRFGPLPPSKDVWLQQLREMPPRRKERFLQKLLHTQRRVWLLWRQRSGALTRQQQQQAQEQQEGAGGGLPGTEHPALSWPQQRLWLARAAGSGKPAGKRERPPGNTSSSRVDQDDVPASPVKKQQLLWCAAS